MKKFIIFDMMGVIFTVGDDVNELLIPYVKSINSLISSDNIRSSYLEASLGKISAAGFWENIGITPAGTGQVQEEYLSNSFTLDTGFIGCASVLKERYALAVLSNDISEWNRFLRNKYGINKVVRDEFVFISSDLGLRKPDPEIYSKMLEKLNACPHECVFIDDSPDRVDAAERLGITSVLFNRENFTYKGFQVKSFDDIACLLLGVCDGYC